MEDKSLIRGLLAKRDQLRRERVETGERMAILARDIEAVERILATCGFTGELPEEAPKPSRYVIFHRGELRSYILRELRSKGEALTPRELAIRLCASDGRSGTSEDRRLLSDVTKRIGDTLRKLKKEAIVTSRRDDHRHMDHWSAAEGVSNGIVRSCVQSSPRSS